MKEKKHNKINWSLIVKVVVSAVLLFAVIVAVYYNSKLDLIQYDNTQTTNLVQEEDRTALNNLPDPTTAPAETVQERDVTNVLLIGTNDWGKLSDSACANTLLILSVNTKLHTAKLVSIQYHVEVEDAHGQEKEISRIFLTDGAQGVLQAVQTHFDLPIDCYMRVNYTTFSKGIDVLGGVDIELTQREAEALNGEIFTNATTRHEVKTGMNHLDGYDALQYCRLQYIDSDCRRNQRQRNVVQSAIDRAKAEDFFTLDELTNTVLPLIQTNMSKGEITELLLEVPGFLTSKTKVQQLSLPAEDTYTEIIREDGKIVISMDFEENADILHDYLYRAETAS